MIPLSEPPPLREPQTAPSYPRMFTPEGYPIISLQEQVDIALRAEQERERYEREEQERAARPPVLPLDMSQIAVDMVMDARGIDVVLEDLAQGKLPNALAIEYNLPIIKFRRWLERSATAEDIAEAMSYAAESMVAHSRTALADTDVSGPTAMMIRASADRAFEIAGKLKPVQWGKQQEAAGSGQTIQVNIMGNIPGLDALKTPGAPSAPHAALPILNILPKEST